jgi:hypothetical protein
MNLNGLSGSPIVTTTVVLLLFYHPKSEGS